MNLSPLARQFLVAGSTYLAALSAGGLVGYPGVLLEQLKSNDTIIQIDLNKGSWIGSIHGIGGIPSILSPIIMQCRGRRFAFNLSCFCIITGWIFTYLAQNITTLIIGECFHGFGGNSLLAVSFLSVSEMVRPKYRDIGLLLYETFEAVGISLVGILGRYLHWKTVGLIMCSPCLIALALGFAWPDSPSWLAYKGKFSECEKSFIRLTGTDEESKEELKEIISLQRQHLKTKTNSSLQDLWTTITRRDFYLPTFHNFILINVIYWGGGMPVLIYSTDMIFKISGKFNAHAKLAMDILFVVNFNIAIVCIWFCGSKKVMLFSMFGAAFFMWVSAIMTYLQGVVTVSKELRVYCLVGYMAFFSLGSFIALSMSSEIMPVKHRGVGGSLYALFTCVLHASSLKAYPYLSLYMNIWGVFLLYAVYATFSIIFIVRYVPETKNRTLEEIERYYNYGRFKDVNKDEGADEAFVNAGKSKILSCPSIT